MFCDMNCALNWRISPFYILCYKLNHVYSPSRKRKTCEMGAPVHNYRFYVVSNKYLDIVIKRLLLNKIIITQPGLACQVIVLRTTFLFPHHTRLIGIARGIL